MAFLLRLHQFEGLAGMDVVQAFDGTDTTHNSDSL